MQSLPFSVARYIHRETNEQSCDAYICLDECNCVLFGNGVIGGANLKALSEQRYCKGSTVSAETILDSGVADDVLEFLSALLPADQTATIIENVQLNDNGYFDIHLFHDFHGQWAVFFDRTLSAQRIQREQQIRLEEDFEQEQRSNER